MTSSFSIKESELYRTADLLSSILDIIHLRYQPRRCNLRDSIHQHFSISSVKGEMAIFASDPEAGLPKLKPNIPRIVESILFVIHEAIAAGRPATKYEIAKAIFIADTRHLETFGRPITYDNYVAMKDGPVPSRTLDLLQPGFEWARIGGSPLWETRPAPQFGPNAIQYVGPKRKPNLEKLSETDQDALRAAIAEVQAMGFHKTRDYTHRLPAYKKAWASRGDAKRKMIDYRDLPADDDLIDDLVHASHHI